MCHHAGQEPGVSSNVTWAAITNLRVTDVFYPPQGKVHAGRHCRGPDTRVIPSCWGYVPSPVRAMQRTWVWGGHGKLSLKYYNTRLYDVIRWYREVCFPTGNFYRGDIAGIVSCEHADRLHILLAMATREQNKLSQKFSHELSHNTTMQSKTVRVNRLNDNFSLYIILF